MIESKTISITNELGKEINKNFGRDIGKIFRLKEMPAMAKEKWSAKMYALVKKSASKIPTEKLIEIEKTKNENSATLAVGLMEQEAVSEMPEYLELQNEHLYCYEIFDKLKDVFVKITPENIDEHICEVATLQYLREQAIEFNLSFIKDNR